jgi:D-xylose transport system substrate-binding protein
MISVPRRTPKGGTARTAGYFLALAVPACLGIAACSSSSSPSTPSSGSSSSSGAVPSISVSSLTNNFAAMASLKPLAPEGKGDVAVILPDTVSSARYTEFDAPYLSESLAAAGLSPSQFSVQNAQGTDATELTDAQEAITKGASVLVMDPLDSGIGAQIESYAKSHGVAVVDYDRLTLGGSRGYYVSFDNVKVGTLIGNGMEACAQAWHVTKPNVLVMKGAPTDNNATLFAQGYLGVLNPLFSAGSWVNVGEPPGTWDPPTAETEFQQQFTAHKNINAVLVPNDENAAPIITYLQRLHVKPNTFPVTGQDATLIGLQNILAGYQCGTVYKPVFEEAQAAAAIAMYLRADKTPPSTLVNGKTTDTQTHTSVPSVLLTPEWVTSQNMASTVIADQFVPAQQLCTGSYAAACKTAGINV